MVRLLVVLLQIDYGVLSLGYLQILHDTGILTRPPALAQSIGLESTGRMSFRQGIDMDGDKQIGLVLIGYLCPLVQFHELIGLTGIDDLHVGAVLLHQSSEGQRELQCQVLLPYTGTTDSAGIATAMSGIDDQRKIAICSCRNGCKAEKRNQN